MLSFADELRQYYPDGIVYRFSENKSLYYRALREKNMRGYSEMKDFLEGLGFVYSNGVDNDVIKNEIKEYITEHYSGNEIVISDLPSSILYRIYRLGNSKDVLNELGFNVSLLMTGSQSNFDYFSIRKIYEEYRADGLNGTKLAELVGTSRQVINNILRGKVQDQLSGDSWKITELSEDEIEIILEMIIGHTRKATLNGMNVTLYVNGIGKTLIWMCSEDNSLIRVMFDENIPEDIRELFKESGISYHFEDEEKFLDDLQLVHIIDHRYVKNGTLSTTKWKSECEKYSKHRNMSLEEYYDFIDVYGVARHVFSFEEVGKQLSEIANDDYAVSSANKTVR